MTVINGQSLLNLAPIIDMLPTKVTEHGVSHGLSEVGYDIRIKQDVRFSPPKYHAFDVSRLVQPTCHWIQTPPFRGGPITLGNLCLASAIEEFDMPDNLVGIVHDKSTWARRGLSVLNTVIEPGWRGFLTLELVFNGLEDLIIPAGAGIAQVVFHQISDPVRYEGKYQDQADEPVPARSS